MEPVNDVEFGLDSSMLVAPVSIIGRLAALAGLSHLILPLYIHFLK